MAKVVVKLTKKQAAEIQSLRDGKRGTFALFAQAFIDDPNDHRSHEQAGTIHVYYYNEEQCEIISKALIKAAKLK